MVIGLKIAILDLNNDYVQIIITVANFNQNLENEKLKLTFKRKFI